MKISCTRNQMTYVTLDTTSFISKPTIYTSKFSSAIISANIIKASSLISDQKDRDYVFSTINITEAKIKALGDAYEYREDIANIIGDGLGYYWKHIFMCNMLGYVPNATDDKPLLYPRPYYKRQLIKIVDAYQQHANEYIERLDLGEIHYAWNFIISHMDTPQFKRAASKFLRQYILIFPGMFYTYATHEPFYALMKKHFDISPILIGTRPYSISDIYALEVKATVYQRTKLITPSVPNSTPTLEYIDQLYDQTDPLAAHNGCNPSYKYIGDDLYMTDEDGRIISINGIDYEVVKGISTGDRLSRIALRMHPLSYIALKLKDKVETKLIPGFVNLLYYAHNKSIITFRKKYGVTSLLPAPKEYVGDFKPMTDLDSEMTASAYKAVPIDDSRIMVCMQIYSTNASGIYTINVADTILNGYVDKTTITYDIHANTVTLN